MRIFIDANVLVSVLCNEYPSFTFTSRILNLSDNPQFQVYTSPLGLAISFYFASKKNGEKLAKKKIAILCEKLNITLINEDVVKKAISNSSVEDFEDGLEYYSAIYSKCKCIITEDKNDFYFSEIEILGCEEFLMKYAMKKK